MRITGAGISLCPYLLQHHIQIEAPPVPVNSEHRHRIDKYLDTLLAMKSEATAIFAPQDGRWKITVWAQVLRTEILALNKPFIGFWQPRKAD